MNQTDNNHKRMSTREKIIMAGMTGLFAAIGAVLGVIAYYQHWLG